MATAANKKSVMDVSKPGKTAATATSRPVIITHGAIVKDPMVNEEAATDTPAQEPVVSAPSAPKKVIAPLTEATTTSTESSEAAPPAAEVKATEPEPTTPEKDTTEPDTESQDEEAVVDAVVEQVADKKAVEQAEAEEEKRQQLITSLVTEKKYFVPLAVARHNRNNKLGVLFIVILLPLIVGLVLAVDAEIIGQGINLPFDLIKR